jgi:hypothetical protein
MVYGKLSCLWFFFVVWLTFIRIPTSLHQLLDAYQMERRAREAWIRYSTYICTELEESNYNLFRSGMMGIGYRKLDESPMEITFVKKRFKRLSINLYIIQHGYQKSIPYIL